MNIPFKAVEQTENKTVYTVGERRYWSDLGGSVELVHLTGSGRAVVKDGLLQSYNLTITETQRQGATVAGLPVTVDMNPTVDTYSMQYNVNYTSNVSVTQPDWVANSTHTSCVIQTWEEQQDE